MEVAANGTFALQPGRRTRWSPNNEQDCDAYTPSSRRAPPRRRRHLTAAGNQTLAATSASTRRPRGSPPWSSTGGAQHAVSPDGLWPSLRKGANIVARPTCRRTAGRCNGAARRLEVVHRDGDRQRAFLSTLARADCSTAAPGIASWRRTGWISRSARPRPAGQAPRRRRRAGRPVRWPRDGIVGASGWSKPSSSLRLDPCHRSRRASPAPSTSPMRTQPRTTKSSGRSTSSSGQVHSIIRADGSAPQTVQAASDGLGIPNN